MTPAKIRTMIVDDEPLARKRLSKLLEDSEDYRIVGECAGGAEAIEAVERLAPDLLFLDIQMPEVNGFDVLMNLRPEDTPFVIFVTAHDQYALKAFEVNAIDYLLKPFDRERFGLTLARAREEIRKSRVEDLQKKIDQLLGELPREQRSSRLIVKTGGRVTFLSNEEIDWLESAGNYLRIHVGKEVHLMRQTMGAMESQLDPEKFVRIHRSAMVNLDRIKELLPSSKGEFEVVLKTGKRLILSRKYRPQVEAMLGRPL